MSSLDQNVEARRLIEAAREALQHAHAPYSRFRVAAAVADEQGRVFTGVNVENASYGLAMCAERVAIFTAISAGARAITAVAVTAERAHGVSPCGACRQVMAEFCQPDVPVWSDGGGEVIVFTVGGLLPHAFSPQTLQGADAAPPSA